MRAQSPVEINRPKIAERAGTVDRWVPNWPSGTWLISTGKGKIVAVACDIAKRSHQIRVQLALYLQVPLIRTTYRLMILDIIYILTIEYTVGFVEFSLYGGSTRFRRD